MIKFSETVFCLTKVISADGFVSNTTKRQSKMLDIAIKAFQLGSHVMKAVHNNYMQCKEEVHAMPE